MVRVEAMNMKNADKSSGGARSWRGLALGAACLGATVLLAGAPAASARPPASVYWGAQIGDQITGEAAPWDMNPVYRLEHLAGKGLSLIEFGAPFAECGDRGCVATKFPSTPLENVRRYGAVPIFSWSSASSPPAAVQPDFQLSDVIAGRYDSYVREFATKAKEWGHPFFLRFDWEMNGFWFPWSEGINGNRAGEFVAAWRHVHDIFTGVGATNVSWVWCPNVDLYNTLTPLGKLYPGDAYVDWTGLDGFNWGNRRGSPGWQNFNQIFHRTYKRIIDRVAPGKPLMLAEVASTDKGGSKAAWISDMLGKVRHRYRKIRAIVWYDINDRGTHWPLESSSKKAKNAFRRGIRAGAYRPNLYADLRGGPIPPPAR
jgi:hypothetical protein